MRKVSVIVTHHLRENEKYLNAAVDSLHAQTVKPDIILVSSAEKKQFGWHHWDPELNNATKKVHYAVDNLIPEEHDIMLMSDDVVISPNTVEDLMSGAELGCIQNPISNNEHGSRWISFGEPHQPSYPYNPKLIDKVLKMSPGPKHMFQVPWISFYCTYIPREVWNKVGRLDERLEVRHNDQDYCFRAARLGIPTFINTGGFALHFGSKTLPKVTSQEEYEKASQVFKEKYSL